MQAPWDQRHSLKFPALMEQSQIHRPLAEPSARTAHPSSQGQSKAAAPILILRSATSPQGTRAPLPAREHRAKSGMGASALPAEPGAEPQGFPQGWLQPQPPTASHGASPAPSHLLRLPLCPPAHCSLPAFGDTWHRPQAAVGTALHKPPKTPAAPSMAGRAQAGNGRASRAARIPTSSLDPWRSLAPAQHSPWWGTAWAQPPGSPAWEEMVWLLQFKKARRTWFCHHPSPSKTCCFLWGDAELIKDGDSGTAIPRSRLYLPSLLPGCDEGGHPRRSPGTRRDSKG